MPAHVWAPPRGGVLPRPHLPSLCKGLYVASLCGEHKHVITSAMNRHHVCYEQALIMKKADPEGGEGRGDSQCARWLGHPHCPVLLPPPAASEQAARS